MCVQVHHATNGDVHVADCHHPDNVWLIFGAEEWQEFLAEVRGPQAVYARRHRRVRLKDPRRPKPIPPTVAQTRAAEPWWVQASAFGKPSTPPRGGPNEPHVHLPGLPRRGPRRLPVRLPLMALCWISPPPAAPPPPVIVVPAHAHHGRLRDRLTAALGLDDDASDDAIVCAVRLLLPAP